MGVGTAGGMRVLVVGSGAREHALAWACERSPQVASVLCAPGNGGTAAVAENVAVEADDVEGLTRLARERAVDLVVIGPDGAIAAGLADRCAEAGIAVFGPTAAAGRIESSKRFAKEVMAHAGIPTARWRAATLGERGDALRWIDELDGRCVVKADGLALGKGVAVCDDRAQARAALDACLLEGRFGDAGSTVVVEERLEGREVSVFALSDGERTRLLAAACDYKRAEDGDRGPNTGGMGAYAPPLGLDTGALLDEAAEHVVQPCVDALRDSGAAYRGCLYAGLMLTPEGPRVLEFNARFGDPETQVLLPMLAGDVVELLLDSATGRLQPGRASLHGGGCVGVVAASAGYPGRLSGGPGRAISGLAEAEQLGGVICFHAGTVRDDQGTLRTAGGRVLTVVARATSVEGARTRAYEALALVGFEGMRARTDIAALPGSAGAAGTAGLAAGARR